MTTCEQKRRDEINKALNSFLEKYENPTEHERLKEISAARFRDGFITGYRKAKGWKDE